MRLENLRSARCSPSVFFEVIAARKTCLITAHAVKNKRTARLLESAREDHSILLLMLLDWHDGLSLMKPVLITIALN